MIAATGSQQIARFVSKPDAELIVDEKLYDLCREFGADSLAALSVLIGHELTHFYGRHTEWAGFGQLPGQQKPSAAQAEKIAVLEAQADMQGGYRAFLAGYDIYRLIRPLYTKIYAAYQLPDTMPGYPTRENRIQYLEQQAINTRKLGMAFEAGLFFFLRKKYDLAERYFGLVADNIPSKEVLNNIGLCQLLRASQAMTLPEMPFRYPFELETSNRLAPDGHRGNEVDKADLLKQAISYFRQAIELDETYSAAYINLASASSLLGRNGTAKETIDQLEEILKSHQDTLPANAHLVRAIALAEQGQDKAAVQELKLAGVAHEIEYNREAMQNFSRLSTLPAQQAWSEWSALTRRHQRPERGNLNFKEKHTGSVGLPLPAKINFTDQLAIPEPHQLRIQSSRSAGEVISTYYLVRSDTTYEVIRSLPGAPVQTAKGVRSGDSLEQLTSHYGPPQRIVPTGNGNFFYCYDAAQLFVCVQNRRIDYWLIHTIR